MNCDCVTGLEASVANHMRPQAGDDAKAACTLTALCFGTSRVTTDLLIPFRIRGSKKGYTSDKGKETSVRASHCPFCGRATERYEVGQYAALDAFLPSEPA
jgi:hypothetical protein